MIKHGSIAIGAVSGLALALVSSGCLADGEARQANVLEFGAGGNGKTNDRGAFNRAIASLRPGGVLRVPAGMYRIDGTIPITKPIMIQGVGFGSQILETAGATLFQFSNVNDAVIRDLYIGGAKSEPGTALIDLYLSGHNRIDNVTMLGGYYGLHFRGSLLNTIVDLKTGVNFGGFFSSELYQNLSLPKNQYWVYAEGANNPNDGWIAANENTFIAPLLEGGTNGIHLIDSFAQGSLNITGGTIEGITGTAISFSNTSLPSSIRGTHFESNGVDIQATAASNIQISAVVSLGQINLMGDTRNVSITDSVAQNIHIDMGDGVYPGGALGGGTGTGAKRIILQNISTCEGGTSGISPTPVGDPYFGGAYNGPSSPVVPNPAEGNAPRKDIVYTNIGQICGGG
jgi:hypothetical protein